MGRHYYPSKRKTDEIAKTDPQAACVAEAGGTLVRVRLNIKLVGRGCGTLIPVIGTSGEAPCGCFITHPDGQTKEHLCPYCNTSPQVVRALTREIRRLRGLAARVEPPDPVPDEEHQEGS